MVNTLIKCKYTALEELLNKKDTDLTAAQKLIEDLKESAGKGEDIAKSVIKSLGLKVAMNKTKVVSFKNDDFDFLGFHFNHWKTSKKE